MKKIYLLFFILFSSALLFAQSNQLIYSGAFKNGLYAFGNSDEAIQEKVMKVVEEAIIALAADEWDPNVSESWSTLKSNFSNQQITILSDSALGHFMGCKVHAEFYPKSGTKIMDAYLARQQQSIENEKKVRADLAAKKITSQEAAKAINLLDAEIWGAPSHIEVYTNDFPLSDSAVITLSREGFNCTEIKIDGAAYATTCLQTNYGNTFHVTTVCLGNYSKDSNGNLQVEKPDSVHWEKQNNIKIKIYGPVDVALMLLKKFDLKKLNSLLK